MAWYEIEISESCILGGEYHRLCRAFQHAFIHAGAPADMALFARRGALDETRTVYISPASAARVADLLEGFAARPCDQPRLEEVTLVYGVPGAKERLLRAVPEPVARPQERPPAREDAAIYPLAPARKAVAGV